MGSYLDLVTGIQVDLGQLRADAARLGLHVRPSNGCGVLQCSDGSPLTILPPSQETGAVRSILARLEMLGPEQLRSLARGGAS